MHRVLIVQAYCPRHGEIRMSIHPRPIDSEKCPVCAGPVLAHLLGWGTTRRREEVCERFFVGIAGELEVARKWWARRREAEASRDSARVSVAGSSLG